MQSPIWLFDLDNTLHDASSKVFPAIANNMTRYISELVGNDLDTANTLRLAYLRRYGATLKGVVM
ncbi:MAG: hypothetical protein K2P84_06585, partial [Undibacterium sp.]|nr:hypothetical protein [Undibacterium sp.]